MPDVHTRLPQKVRNKGDGFRIDYYELIARRGREYVFLDNVFDTGNLAGAVGTTMAPVSPDEIDRRVQEYKDPETSPLRHIYNEQDPLMSWSEWIQREIAVHGRERMVADLSYSGRYGDTVREYHDGEIDVVECRGGGRMFNTAFQDFDEIYRPDLLALARGVEDYGLGVGERVD